MYQPHFPIFLTEAIVIELPWKNIGSLFLRLVISCSIVSEYHCAWSITVSLSYKQKQNTLSLIKSFKKLHSNIFFFLSLFSEKAKTAHCIQYYIKIRIVCLIAQSCPTLCNTIAHQAPLSIGFSGRKTGGCCHALFQGIFLTQGANSGLLKQADTLPSEPPGTAKIRITHLFMVVCLQVRGRGEDVLMEEGLHEKSHAWVSCFILIIQDFYWVGQ